MIDCIDEVFQLPREKLDKCGKEGRDLRSRTIKTSLISLMGDGNTEQIWAHCFFAQQKANVPKSCTSKPRVCKATFIGKAKRKLQKTT